MKKTLLIAISFSLLASNLYGEDKIKSLYTNQCHNEKDANSCEWLGLESEALKIREENCDKGDISACTDLWFKYRDNDKSKASKLKQKVYSFAEKKFDTKDPIVLYSIGMMFQFVHENNKKAKQYLKSSCEMGSYKGCDLLVNYPHLYDKYGSKEYVKYVKKLDEVGGKLCNEGDKEACRNVAYSHYSEGDGASATENALAEQYFKKGCELGDAQACSEL